MRELSVQASNATNTATDRAALQQEVDTLVQQINTVAGQTAFNGVKLLDGTFNSQSFQVGANTGESITINSIASAKANSLGVGTTSTYTTSESATVTNGAISTGGITVNGYGVGPSVTDGVSSSVSFTSSSAAAANVDIDPCGCRGRFKRSPLRRRHDRFKHCRRRPDYQRCRHRRDYRCNWRLNRCRSG
jgi:flagellin